MASREAALKLIKDRDILEAQIEETRDALKALGVGQNDSLVTADGFPRHDIDVATARQLKVQLIRQENDMKSLLEEIKVNLNNAFPPKKPLTASPGDSQPKPFCVVKSVLSGFLGDKAGLQPDDQIIKFGNVTSIGDLNSEFKRLVGSTLNIKVFRPHTGKTVDLSVTVAPDQSLGCHIVPK